MSYTEKLLELQSALGATFDEGLSQIKGDWSLVATKVPSDSSKNPYRYLGQNLSLQNGNFQKDFEPEDSGYALENEDFHSVLSIKKNDLDDNQIGAYGLAVREMGASCVRFLDEKVFKLLSQGFQENCYDKQHFFSEGHPAKNGTVASNFQKGTEEAWYILDSRSSMKPLIFQERKTPKLENIEVMDEAHLISSPFLRFGVHTRASFGYGAWQQAYASKAALNELNLQKVIENMMLSEDVRGRKMGINPNILVVSPKLRAKAMELLKVERKSDGSINPLLGSLSLLVSPFVVS